ncbi:MAG: BMP family ABC transporter substrate-binding protein [bacterium]
MRTSSRRQFLRYGGATGAALITGLSSNLARSNGAFARESLKVGVVHVAPVAEIGWAKQHSLAVEALQAEFGDRIQINVVENVFDPQHAEQVFRELAENGHDLIFGTSYVHGAAMHSVAPQFPDVIFEQASGIASLENLGTFEARYYEGGYVAGVAAGHMTQSGKIGFIGSYPIPDCISTANALLLGAQSVKPDTTCEAVFLDSWYDPTSEGQAADVLISGGCDVICPMTDSPAGVQVAGERGAWSIGYASDMTGFASRRQLTAFMLDWSSVYVRTAEAVASGNWEPEERWDGLASEVIRMADYNSALSSAVRDKLRRTEAEVGSGALHPFAGELLDRDGNVRVASGETPPAAEIRTMDWYVSGMVTDKT